MSYAQLTKDEQCISGFSKFNFLKCIYKEFNWHRQWAEFFHQYQEIKLLKKYQSRETFRKFTLLTVP